MTNVHPAFTAAERLAPTPTKREDATREQWIRHHAALALAAHTAFHAALKTVPTNPQPTLRPDPGYLMAIATSAAGAAIALATPPVDIDEMLWDLSPSGGALNGEYIDWLADTLDHYGINPADIEPAFNGSDFSSASCPAVSEVNPTTTVETVDVGTEHMCFALSDDCEGSFHEDCNGSYECGDGDHDAVCACGCHPSIEG